MSRTQALEENRIVTDEWRRLSPWSIAELSVRSAAAHVRTAVLAAPALVGLAQTDLVEYAWMLPVAIVALVVAGAILSFVFYAYRIREDSVEVQRGALHRKHLDLGFARIQNISIEEPFYYQPLGLVTLKIDGAGSSGEEVRVIAIKRRDAEAARAFIRARRPDAGAPGAGDAPEGEGELFFTRSLGDLIVHGLTNNRALLAVAGLFGFLSQANVTPADLVARLGIDFDVVVAGMSLVGLVVLFVLSFLLVAGVLAGLSVLVSIVVFYGFSMYRSDESLVVRRGLLTRHEIHLRKSRIQSIALRQDWLDYVLGRRNVMLEPISHHPAPGGQQPAGAGKRIVVPSVRLRETSAVTSEISSARFDALVFTPASKRYFHKHAAIFTAIYAIAAAVWLQLPLPAWPAGALLTLWSLHTALIYMTWKRKGIAIEGDDVVVRSGTIGIDYTIFPAFKIQDVTHVQSVLMRRRNLSTLVFHTASTTVRAPYVDSDFAKTVADYCVYRVEATERSWM